MARLIVRSLVEDIKNFINMLPYRYEKIKEGENIPLPATYKTNELADRLHPESQKAVVFSVHTLGSNAKILTLTGKNGPLSLFRAGQGVNIKKGNHSGFFPILSTPAEDNYKIIVYQDKNDVVSNYLLGLEEGDDIEISGPYGLFCYSYIRDAASVVFICDQYGISPVVSICNSLEKTNRHLSVKMFYLENDKISDIRKTFDVSENVSIYSETELSDILTKISEQKEETSFFISGSNAFCEEIKAVVDKAESSKGKARIYVHNPVEKIGDEGKTYKCEILYRGETFFIECADNETLLSAFERSNIPTQSKCKIGECGYCRCQLLEGDIKTVNCAGIDSVRSADEKYGIIHPCRTFPQSDLVILI